jgi:anti-sigma factor (TIGR02949 family)
MPTRLTHSVPVDCETVVRALWAYIDRELSDEERAAVDAHMAECDHCRAHNDFERRLVQSITALRADVREPDELRDRVLDALRRARTEGEGEGEVG